MTFDYAKSRATADRLIKRFGQVGAIRRETPGTGPGWNPGEPTITDYPCTLVITGYSTHEIDGTRIRADDLKVLVSAQGLTVELTTSDRAVEAEHTGSTTGPSLAIVNVEPLNPGGVTVMLTLQCRR